MGDGAAGDARFAQHLPSAASAGAGFLRERGPLNEPTREAAARVSKGIRIYAIGDVHGRADLLERLRDLAAHPARRAIQVFLGYYVDRGPGSRKVLDRLLDRACSHEAVFLKGNRQATVA